MKDKNIRRMVAKKVCVSAMALGLSVLSTPYANAAEEDVFDIILPAIILASKPISYRITYPLEFKSRSKQITCWPIKCDVPVKDRGKFVYDASDGYKFCAKKIDYVSRSSDATVSIAGNSSQINIQYDIPCTGGGIAVSTWGDAMGVAVSFAIGIVAGPEYSSGIYDIIKGTATVTGVIGSQLISGGVAKVSEAYHQEGTCGIGDWGNFLTADVHVFAVRYDLNCPSTSAGWEPI